ncbi:MAG: ABC transporter ATP-binding protein, partial [Candidatus Bathyarchaeia archaeon]
AVDDVSFNLDLEKSGILTIAGERGSGKTTIARLILRFIKPDKGEILYRGQNIWKMNKKELKNYRRKVQAVFQDPFAAFNPIYKVDHLLRATIKKFGLAKSEKETEDLLLKSFEFLKLRPEMLSKYPSQLSGGERQRVMLCRAILPKPDLIIADEPVSMLDTTIRIGVLEEMLKVKEQFGVSFIYITHDLATASVLGGDVMILYQGSAVEMGPIDKVLRRPAHPYTQLLVSSIPSPDPDRKSSFLDLSKMTAPTQEKGEIKTGRIKGCKFYSRCDRRRESCLSESPQMLEMGDRLVRCPFAED